MKKVDISAVVCTYNDPIQIFQAGIHSLVQQKNIHHEIIVIDMSTNDAIKNVCAMYPSVQYHFVPQSKGLSDSRNRGAKVAKSKYVAFLDADAIPTKDWLYHIYTAFKAFPTAGVVGGKIVPKWETTPNILIRNARFTDDFFSLLDLGDETKKVEKIIGANFALDKSKFKQLFSTTLGRGRTGQLGGEETDLCRRARRSGYDVVYSGGAKIHHFVPIRKMRFKWLAYRAYYMGVSRSLLKGKPSPYVKKRSLADYLFIAYILIPYLFGYVKGNSLK